MSRSHAFRDGSVCGRHGLPLADGRAGRVCTAGHLFVLQGKSWEMFKIVSTLLTLTFRLGLDLAVNWLPTFWWKAGLEKLLV